MKNIKKSVLLLAAVFVCTAAPPVLAESSLYGKNLTQISRSGRVVDGTFEDYMTDGDDKWKKETWPFNNTIFFDKGASGDRTLVAGITDEEARNGSQSLKFDMDALARCSTNQDKSARIILQANMPYAKSGVTYYYEAWVKIADEAKAEMLDVKRSSGSEWENTATIRLDDYGDGGKYTNGCGIAFSDSETDEKGWRKISFTKECIADSGNIKIGPAVHNWYPEGEGIGAIYYDDISVYALPESIRAEIPKKIYDTDEAVELSSIKIYGKDKTGEEEEFTDYKNISYSVVSGEAEIKDGKLYYNGTGGGNVVLKADFIGVSSEMTVKFGSPIKVYGITKNSDNTYRAVVGDTTLQGIEVTVIAAVFDENNVMRRIAESPKTQLANPSVIMTPVVDTEGITSPKVKIFIWDSLSGMTPYSEIIEP